MTRKKRASAPGQRQLRVGEEIRHALADIIAQDMLDDPDLAGKMVTVTQVSVSPDLRNATAFVVPFGVDGDAQTLVAALNRAHGFFRRELARMVKLQFSPQIRFKEDETFEQASKIERLLHDPVVARDLARDDDEDEDARDEERRDEEGRDEDGDDAA
jgi:ribosome-binding factor A